MPVSLNPRRSHPNTFKREKRIQPYHHAHARVRAHTHSRRSLRPSFVPVRGFRAHHHSTNNTQNSIRFCLFAVLKFVLSAGQQVSLPFPLSLQQLLHVLLHESPSLLFSTNSRGGKHIHALCYFNSGKCCFM